MKVSASKLKQLLVASVGSIYSVCQPDKLNLKIIIYIVETDFVDKPDLLSCIITANDLRCSPDDLKLVTKFKYKKVFNMVVETKPTAFHQIISKGALYVRWKMFIIMKHFSLSRCHKCCKFGHKAAQCRSNNNVCIKCSGNHRKNKCQLTVKNCVNYVQFNAKFKSTLSTDHAANDPQCHVYIKKKI